ncbi:MAG: hypothetical protein CMJ46_14215 [Planctomyces sp.]|nr:hypothetical protein [Planctomyces sp.]
MKSEERSWITIILTSAAVGAFLLWGIQSIWHIATEIDHNPSRAGVKSQLMHRKSAAMHDILDAMVAGNLKEVHSEALRMERYGETIDEYLASETYDKSGADFHQAVDDLIVAAAQEESDNAKEAVLRLERSCIECHMILNTHRVEPE